MRVDRASRARSLCARAGEKLTGLAAQPIAEQAEKFVDRKICPLQLFRDAEKDQRRVVIDMPIGWRSDHRHASPPENAHRAGHVEG